MTARAYADWGDPRPAEWLGPREPLSARLPPDLVREIRERSRVEGISVSATVQRLLEAGLERRSVASGAAHADLVSTLFD
jgi:DNA-binding MarR family transcriptional regulator